MRKMIKEYEKGCEMLAVRIDELTGERRKILAEKNGNCVEIGLLDRRIDLLKLEYRQTREIIDYLSSYVRRVEERVKKNDIS